jgi:DNA polymerase-4
VAAASYEARKFGVRSAMPSVTARRKCPELVFVPPRFDVHRAVSQQIRAIFARYTLLIQPLSLDEAYLDVTAPLVDRGSATAIAEEIKTATHLETGLTASAGVSYNKFLAKLASDYRKPDGLFVITPQMAPAFVVELPVGKFHGVGPGDGSENEQAWNPYRARPETADARLLDGPFRQGGRFLLPSGASRGRPAGGGR